jgi:ribosomal protein S18 acetylase RimI-like enzyme
MIMERRHQGDSLRRRWGRMPMRFTEQRRSIVARDYFFCGAEAPGTDEPPACWHGERVIHGLALRAVTVSDLDDVVPLAGSRDRAQARVQVADRGDESMFVAAAASRLIGVISVRWREGCDPPHPWLYGLYVAPEARRHGVGAALVQVAEAESERRGADHISLDVDVDDTPARSFYEALGYTVVRGHEHRWRSVNPRTGAVTGEGTTPTFILRRRLLR